MAAATIHMLRPLPAHQAVRRYRGVAIGRTRGRIEVEINAVDAIDAHHQLIDLLGEIPLRITVRAITGAPVGDKVDTEPSISGELDSPAVPGPVRDRTEARINRKALRSASQQRRHAVRWVSVFTVLPWLAMAVVVYLARGQA
jgi:hypothetical protein